MTTATISNFRTAKKLNFRGFRVTEAQFYAYQEARTRKFQHLVTQYKRLRGPILNDLDFDNITGDLRSWSLRWLRRVLHPSTGSG